MAGAIGGPAPAVRIEPGAECVLDRRPHVVRFDTGALRVEHRAQLALQLRTFASNIRVRETEDVPRAQGVAIGRGRLVECVFDALHLLARDRDLARCAEACVEVDDARVLVAEQLLARCVASITRMMPDSVLDLTFRREVEPTPRGRLVAALERGQIGEDFAARGLHEIGTRLAFAQSRSGASADKRAQRRHVLGDQLFEHTGIAGPRVRAASVDWNSLERGVCDRSTLGTVTR